MNSLGSDAVNPETSLDQGAEDARMGHVRLDECHPMPTPGPLYQRISELIERIGSERRAAEARADAASAHYDSLRSQLIEAHSLRIAAEYERNSERLRAAAETARLSGENEKLKQEVERHQLFFKALQ